MGDESILAELRSLEIETPSWGYGNSGTWASTSTLAWRCAHGLGAGTLTRASCTG